jgi:hypothetical protein
MFVSALEGQTPVEFVGLECGGRRLHAMHPTQSLCLAKDEQRAAAYERRFGADGDLDETSGADRGGERSGGGGRRRGGERWTRLLCTGAIELRCNR